MAEDLDDGEFWLPSEFLADDNFMEKKKESGGGFENESRVCFPVDFSYGFGSYGSALSSPVESVVGSTETESDEEDYMAGLTRKMASSTLQDEDKTNSPGFSKGVVAGSPQSTLCTMGTWSSSGLGSSSGSSNGPSQVPSPTSATPMYEKEVDAWELLYAAAGQVVRMKMNDETLKFHSRGVLGSPRKLPSAASLPVKPQSTASLPVKPQSTGFYHNPAVDHQRFNIHQFQQLKQQQMMKQQQQQQHCSSAWGRQGVKPAPAVQQQLQPVFHERGFGNGRSGRPLGLPSSAWPPLQQQQQQPGSGMRAVFLGGQGSRESCGTGVFLPRRAGNPTETRKKSGCSTVLLPARVVQALNLNLDEMDTGTPRFQGGSLVLDRDYMVGRGNTLHAQAQRQNMRIPPTVPNHEIHLPQEWTY
ncbi:hypothetical protein CKAN_02127400 [Cinnamomum micranthum f. kanehirae]|uniref:TIP41-like protein n=1 Tax=Cinnamomum micranthum f. kanehirae TaxID=337451 RepID=A0A3S3N4D5_9MAGN|nr:hypothetical protein CKAN_02127400 [Cinnamomum micranthum f. kanehirae]